MYRARYMRKNRYDQPKGKEYDLWKQQLPEWLVTSRLNIPEIPEDKNNNDD